MSELIQYIKVGRKKPRRKGFLYADNVDGEVRIGYSLCNFKSGDKFCKYSAYDIAFDRASIFPTRFNKKKHIPNVPDSIKYSLYSFINRAGLYFKDGIMTPWALAFIEKIDERKKIKEAEEKLREGLKEDFLAGTEDILWDPPDFICQNS